MLLNCTVVGSGHHRNDIFSSGRIGWVAVIISAILSFGPTWLLGLPLFIVLRAWNRTQLWLAVRLGFGIATMTWIIFSFIILPLWLGLNPDSHSIDATVLTESDISRDLVGFLFIGMLGSIVGATLWFIARPDRAPHVLVKEK